MSDGISTCPCCAAEWQRDLRDYADGFAAGQRGPVVPIPVSEPPGDNDIVLLAVECPSPLYFLFDRYPLPWSEAVDGDFRMATDPGFDYDVATHYLLLQKGE